MKSSRDSIDHLMTSVRHCVSISVVAGYFLLSLTTIAKCRAAADNNQMDDKPKVIGVTCWTCNKTNNKDCNDRAPNNPCPIEFSVCKTVHRFNYITDTSHRVVKQCSSPVMCSAHHVGCRNISYLSHITECTSCCDYQFCNERIPFNNAIALTLSSVISSGASSERLTSFRNIVSIPMIDGGLTSIPALCSIVCGACALGSLLIGQRRYNS